MRITDKTFQQNGIDHIDSELRNKESKDMLRLAKASRIRFMNIPPHKTTPF